MKSKTAITLFTWFLLLVCGMILFFCKGSGGSRTAEEHVHHVHKEHSGHNHTEEGHLFGNSVTLTEEQIKAAGVEIGKLEERNLTATFRANGMLRVPNNNRGKATALYGGVVKSLHVQIGTAVSKGQVIATIENPAFIQLQEEYLTVQNQIVLAEQELQRQQELFEGNAGTRKNLQTATSELNNLKIRKGSLQEQIQLMGIRPETISEKSLKSALTVVSPIRGTVSNLYATVGSYVDAASPLAEIVDNTSLHLDLHVFERDLPRMRVGQTLNFTLTNNPVQSYTAKVFTIGSSFENESKTIAVHCHVIGNKIGLIDGMNVTGEVSLEDVKTLAVPTDAVVESEGKYFVFIEGEEPEEHEHNHEHGHGEARFVKVEVVKGVTSLGYTGITPVKSLRPDTRLVVKGGFFVNAKLAGGAGHDHAH